MSSGNLFQPFPFRLFESNQYKILPNHQWAFYQHPVCCQQGKLFLLTHIGQPFLEVLLLINQTACIEKFFERQSAFLPPSFNSSAVGLSSTMCLSSKATPFSVSHAFAFLQVLHLGYSKTKYAFFRFLSMNFSL